MSRLKALPPSLLGLSIIAAFLLGLAFLPPLFERSSFTYSSTDKPSPKLGFPLDQSLPLLKAGSSRSEMVSLRKLASGSPGGLLINFWATWCPPCIEELPSLEFLRRQLGSQPKGKLPLLITISVDEQARDVFALYETLDFRPSFDVLHDAEGNVAKSVGTSRFPETYWVSASGEILHKWIGPQNWLGDDVIRLFAEISRR